MSSDGCVWDLGKTGDGVECRSLSGRDACGDKINVRDGNQDGSRDARVDQDQLLTGTVTESTAGAVNSKEDELHHERKEKKRKRKRKMMRWNHSMLSSGFLALSSGWFTTAIRSSSWPHNFESDTKHTT